jgi:hypothetical protein
VVQESVAAGAAGHSLAGASLGGTYQYSAPEQLGLGVGKVGPWSDVYAFGKTLSQALFQTSQPTRRHYLTLGDHSFADLLSDCLEQEPSCRPQDFGVVLEALADVDEAACQAAKNGCRRSGAGTARPGRACRAGRAPVCPGTGRTGGTPRRRGPAPSRGEGPGRGGEKARSAGTESR